MRATFLVITLLGLSMAAGRSVRAESEHEGGDDGGSDGAPSVVRPQHDVGCGLQLPANAVIQAGSSVKARIVVRNKTRHRERGVSIAVFANDVSGTPIWTGTVNLRAHSRVTRRPTVEVPSGTTSLVAVASCAGDDNPGNDYDSVPVDGTGNNSGSSVPFAAAGAATYATSCVSCHGTNAGGTSSGPRIRGASASEVLEAVREGEDGMPRFPGIAWQDARNLAAYLADPSAVTPPSPPVITPPAGQAPTYTAQVKPIFAASCVACHTGANAPAGIRLENYTVASANATAAVNAIVAGRMPPGGPLPAATQQVIADWIAGGMKQ